MAEKKKVYLFRFIQNDKQTLGTITIPHVDLWTGKTLELPWLNNQSEISCYPDGEYLCKYTRSPLFSERAGKDIFTYEIFGVEGRAGLRIHPVNFFYQLRGCTGIGSAVADINQDNQLDITNSQKTVEEFEKKLKYKDFILVVKTFI